MTTVAINRVKTVMRIPASAMREKSRVERIVGAAIDQVESALEQAGLSPLGHLCIKNLHTIVRLRLHEPDSILAAKLGRAIALAIDGARRGDSNSSVYYSSRVHLLIDLITSAMRADFARSWAWTQLAIWRDDAGQSASAAAEQVMRTLANESQYAIAALSHVARDRYAFIEMLRWAPQASWIVLTQVALKAAGPSIDFLEPIDTEPHSIARPIAIRMESQSAIAQALSTATFLDLPRATVRSLAVLVVLEVEPAAIRPGAEPTLALIDEIERLLQRAIAGESALPSSDIDERMQQRDAIERAERSPDSDSEVRSDPRAIEALHGESPLAEVRREAATEAGGLLYLINLATRIGLPDFLLADQRLARRGLRWALHQLAMTLLCLDARDPATLCFAGLLPDAVPPDSDDLLPNDDELLALAEYRTMIFEGLRASLATFLDQPDQPDADLLEFVCRRRAQIFADPGWIEAHFSSADISTEIRHAGLDFDPGWISWLGVVVRFVYA